MGRERERKQFKILTKEDLWRKSGVECAVELRENDYFLYKLEKEIARNSSISDFTFNLNPKYMDKHTPGVHKWMFEDSFQVNPRRNNSHSISFHDLQKGAMKFDNVTYNMNH